MRVAAALLAVIVSTVAAAAAAASEAWPDFAFLIGTWTAEDSAGAPGKASRGETIFQTALDERILTRKNFAEYPAADGRPASRHEDLMVIYRAAAGSPMRAKYFDNEGHVIDYTVTATANTIVFTSDVVPGAPRFRLTYRKLANDRVAGEFEIAKPGAPENFSRYLEWTMKRAGG